MSDATVDDIARRLMSLALADALPIDAACRALLERLFVDAAERIVVDDRGDRALDDAEHGLRALLDDFRRQRRILRVDTLGPPVLASALDRLCPLPPFC